MTKYLELAAAAAAEIEKRYELEAGAIKNDLPEFGGSGRTYQIQTDKDNWTGERFAHGTLAKDEWGRDRTSFVYKNQLHYLIHQD